MVASPNGNSAKEADSGGGRGLRTLGPSRRNEAALLPRKEMPKGSNLAVSRGVVSLKGRPAVRITLAPPRSLSCRCAPSATPVPTLPRVWFRLSPRPTRNNLASAGTVKLRRSSQNTGGADCRHAASVALRHCAAASDRKIRSVDRETRWRWRLKVLWTAA